MISIGVLLILVVSVCAVTRVYDRYGHLENAGYVMFDDRTFGMDLYPDPCTRVSVNKKFRDVVNNAMPCVGQWCINGKFACTRTNNVDCYHVEHIFDTKGDDFYGQPDAKDLAANLVMSFGRWNSALGGVANRYYQDSKDEKLLVYGIDRMRQVYNTIQMCVSRNRDAGYGSVNDTFADDCDDDTISEYECDSDSFCGCDGSTDDFEDDYTAVWVLIGAVVFLASGWIVVVMMIVRRCWLKKKAVNRGETYEYLL